MTQDSHVEIMAAPETPQTITISCQEDALGEFISNLLGRPQRVTRSFDCTFDFGKDFIQGIEDILKQRLGGQNSYQIISFSAEVESEQGYKRKVGSMEELMAFKEVDDIASNYITASWTILVLLPGKKSPEKQVISISVDNGRREKSIYDKKTLFINAIGKITIEINYTERTLGDDIESLLSKYIRSSSNHVHFLKVRISEKFFEAVIVTIGFIFTPIIFLLRDYLKNNEIENNKHGWSVNLSIDEKLNTIFSYLSSDKTPDVSGFIQFITILIAIIIFISFPLYMLIRVPSSHIILTKGAEKKREKMHKKEKMTAILFIVTFLTSVIASIIANNIDGIAHAIKSFLT